MLPAPGHQRELVDRILLAKYGFIGSNEDGGRHGELPGPFNLSQCGCPSRSSGSRLRRLLAVGSFRKTVFWKLAKADCPKATCMDVSDSRHFFLFFLFLFLAYRFYGASISFGAAVFGSGTSDEGSRLLRAPSREEALAQSKRSAWASQIPGPPNPKGLKKKGWELSSQNTS